MMSSRTIQLLLHVMMYRGTSTTITTTATALMLLIQHIQPRSWPAQQRGWIECGKNWAWGNIVMLWRAINYCWWTWSCHVWTCCTVMVSISPTTIVGRMRLPPWGSIVTMCGCTMTFPNPISNSLIVVVRIISGSTIITRMSTIRKQSSWGPI